MKNSMEGVLQVVCRSDQEATGSREVGRRRITTEEVKKKEQ